MKRLNLFVLVAAAAPALLFGAPAQAQNFPTSASTSMLNNIRSSTLGANSVAATNSQILNQSRAFAASTGIAPAQTVNTSISGGARIPTLPSLGAPGQAKPFASTTFDSTVSPYLNLFTDGVGGSGLQTVDNYNVLVRPQLQQQSLNRQVQRQQQQLNMRVQAIAARPAFEAQGSDRMIATGHQTTFRYYSHFYPRLNRR